MREPGLWLREADVVELLSLEDAIGVLEHAYRLKAAGEAANMRRAHLREGERSSTPSGSIAGLGVTGTKTWTYTPGGASPLVILFNLDDGSVRGVIEAFALGQMRTAATSGLATRVLAREDADSLALLGTGKQALADTRGGGGATIASVRVFGRDGARRGELTAAIRGELGVETIECDEVAAAVAGAAVVTAVTRAADPILFGDMLSPGTHVNAVGSIVPSRRELDASAVGRCDTIVADSVEQARRGRRRASCRGGRRTDRMGPGSRARRGRRNADGAASQSQ